MVELIVGLLAFVGVIVGQQAQHRRWAKDQDAKAVERQDALLEKAGKERRAEQAVLAERISEQTAQVLEGALQIAEVHRTDADAARAVAREAAEAHHQCRQEVAALGGAVEELRARMVENERTSGLDRLMAERHQDLKHRAFGLLSAAEGYVGLVQKRVHKCSCTAFDPLEEITTGLQPHISDLLVENAMPIEEWVRQHEALTKGVTP